jgi:hypothetical protein
VLLSIQETESTTNIVLDAARGGAVEAHSVKEMGGDAAGVDAKDCRCSANRTKRS